MYSTSVDGQMLYGHSLGSLVDAVKRYYAVKLATARRNGAVDALEALLAKRGDKHGWEFVIEEALAEARKGEK